MANPVACAGSRLNACLIPRLNPTALASHLGFALLMSGKLVSAEAQVSASTSASAAQATVPRAVEARAIRAQNNEELRRRSQAEALERQRQLQAPKVDLRTPLPLSPSAAGTLALPAESPCFVIRQLILDVPTTGMMLGQGPDGKPMLIQDPAMLATPSSDLQAYIRDNTGNTYSWDKSAPQLSGTPSGALPSIMEGIVTPEMLANRQKNAADFTNWVSTQSGKFSSAAAAYGAYLSSQPNAAAQAGALAQFGMAGTATVVEFGASALEQLLRPDLGKMTVESLSDMAAKPIMDRLPIYNPAINEALDAWKNSQSASDLQDKINGKK